MIEVAESETYYYHYDGLGSVVALSDSSGDTVQTYEYSVYGQVAVEDINHPNPYMFAGRRFDIEIGLYYNRARYYNPFTGRFLQTDPIGYYDGMNSYAYCGNNPLNYLDPSGLIRRFWIAGYFMYRGNERAKLRWKTTGPIITTPKNWIAAPVEGKAWTKKQFWWYYVQNGKFEDDSGAGWAPLAVNLGKVNLLDKFQADKMVIAAVDWYIADIEAAIEAAYEEIKDQQPGTIKRFDYKNSSQKYDFARIETLWKYYNDLIVLGNGFLFCDANCSVNSEGIWTAQIIFSVNDWFIDVLDLTNSIPDSEGSLDFDDGMPYPIVGSWTIEISGKLE